MDSIQLEHEKLERKGNLKKCINDTQKAIDFLSSLSESFKSDPTSFTPEKWGKFEEKAEKNYDAVNNDLKEVYKSMGPYTKALDKKFKDKPLPTAENDALSSHPSLVNRAIAMHLLREGQFDVAATFVDEANAHPPQPQPTASTPNPSSDEPWDKELAAGSFNSKKLQEQFSEMYDVLRNLRQENLAPAINWARQNRDKLEVRGSNLEFELCKLQFVCLFLGRDVHGRQGDPNEGPFRAWSYARSEFGPFQHRYAMEIQQLSGALSFWQNVAGSPYQRMFSNETAWDEVAASFTREFCSLLGLSADSPLYIAATAGAIALPTLLKLQTIMKEKRTEWTTQNELPVEIPLPPAYQFHSIFVCPVSKEQCTDENPPMMLPCCHVIAKESMEKISKGSRFKCPYCPKESNPKEAIKVFL